MALLLTFVGVTIGIATVLWAVSVFVQPYLFGQTIDRLPLRALAGGAILGSFLTFWTYLNTRADPPDKYGTFFEFNATATATAAEFEAVHRMISKGPDGKWKEETVPFKPKGTGKGTGVEFVEVKPPHKPFSLTSANYMTIAILVPKPDGTKARFDAELDDKGLVYRSANKQFNEAGGSRHILGDAPGVVVSPNRWGNILALFLNVLHFALWFVVFFPIMRYGSGLSLGLMAGFGLAAMLVLMPLLKKSNPPPKPVAAAAA